jgi:cytochrome c553
MKRLIALMLPIVSILWAGTPALSQEVPPAWAYPVNPPDFKPPPDDGTPRNVPNSTLTLTLTQVRDLFYSPDWHPEDHPPLPEVVARGRKPELYACGFCHRADGAGGPENANLMGLPAAYIAQQIADFKSGARKSSLMGFVMSLKTKVAKAATEQEIAAAAAYFASVKPRANIRVVESEMVPKTVVAAWFLVAAAGGGTEPIGERIIEIADDLGRYVSRDARVTFTANVPIGSIQKGRDLVAGKDGAVPCGTCHGADLKGSGDIPSIAGKSPTYIFRQLHDYKHGHRAGPASAAMMPSVEKLTTNDMIALSAYAASLAP